MAYVGSLSPEQVKAKLDEVVRVLRERGALAACPRCRHNDWDAVFLGYLVSGLPVAGLNVPPPHVPVLNLTCKNCGSTQLHNLNVLGIQL
jgi:hypothetical protein